MLLMKYCMVGANLEYSLKTNIIISDQWFSNKPLNGGMMCDFILTKNDDSYLSQWAIRIIFSSSNEIVELIMNGGLMNDKFKGKDVIPYLALFFNDDFKFSSFFNNEESKKYNNIF